MTNIKCGRCSSFQSPVYHGSVQAVKDCFAAGYAPKAKVEIPALPIPAVSVPAPVEPKVISYEPKKFNRWSAACPKKDCKTHAVKGHPFTLKCSNHGTPVWTKAKQLEGKLSKSAKHKCNDACMYATGPTCTCGCGGVNHGVGYLVTIAD